MKLPNWLKIVWWLLLIVALTTYLGERFPDLRSGRSVPIDVVVFLVWFGLLLAPLFNEINFFGLELKQQLESVRRDVIDQVQTLKSDIQNTVQISPNITIPIPPPDAQLPAIEQEIRRVLDQRLNEYGISPKAEPAPGREQIQNPSTDISFLFNVRYSIERELRLMMQALGANVKGPLGRLLDTLQQAEIVDPQLARAIRQVYAVCSPAIHGEEVSQNKINFVREVAPELLVTLRRLRETAALQLGPLMAPRGKGASADQ